jgi:putative transposase
MRIREIAQSRVRYGYRKIRALLNREGWNVGKYLVYRMPKLLFCDNGSEFTSHAMDLWAYQNGVKIDFSRPGKPTDNAFVESFNGTFRAECLDAHWFADLNEAKNLIEAWRQEYNESRPHRSLGERTPSEFASQSAAKRALVEPKPADV